MNLLSSYRCITWDYRGLYGSTLPARPVPLCVATHAKDFLAIAKHEKIEEFVFVGWSMGVQIALELTRQAPERLRGLVLMNGTWGRPLRTLPWPFPETFLLSTLQQLHPLHSISSKILQQMSQSPHTSTWLQKTGLLSKQFEPQLLRKLIFDFRELDLTRYFELLVQLSQHDARPLLKDIQVPTLVIGGSEDRITPPRLTEQLAREIPGAETWILSGGSHYAAAEFPELISHRIAEFVDRRCFPQPRPAVENRRTFAQSAGTSHVHS